MSYTYNEHALEYGVWITTSDEGSPCQSYLEEPAQSKCVARFTYLQEALDFARYSNSRKVSCVVTGPHAMASAYAAPKGG